MTNPVPHTGPVNAVNIVVIALVVAALEWFLCYGPPRALLERWLRPHSPNASSLQRNVYQVVIRIIGSIHLAIQLPLALAVVRDPAMQHDRLYSTSPRSAAMLTISAGYFLHDLWSCVTKFSEWGVPYTVHALLCCSLYSYGAISGCLQYYGALFLLWEASTPCVYVRWALHKVGQSDSRAYVINGIAMVVTFFLARNVLGIWMSIDYFMETSRELANPRPGGIPAEFIWGYRIANVLLNSLNAFWFYKMASGAAKLLSKHQPQKPIKAL